MDARIEHIFESALAQPEQDRQRFVTEACGGDKGLASQVMSLLGAHERAKGFLADPSRDAAKPDAPTGPRAESEGGTSVTPARSVLGEGPGSLIGHYKLLQVIGEGGFGVVFMAEQLEPIRRRVALKIIKLGMDTQQVIARFEVERQSLAMMDHPGIARVLDAGTTTTGRPYFVMELVPGLPIVEYCDRHGVSTAERLQLILGVCRAVQHAHHKGIIHRDLKPSNVLVTMQDGAPVPKVIDFGIAKAVNQRLTERTLFTEFHQIVGTPEYMSPEQADMPGLDIDTRTDVYSLGVVLYELLVGSTPFDGKSLRSKGYAEMQRIIREDEPPKPSTRFATLGQSQTAIAKSRHTDADSLGRTLRGELDHIVMKCLEKDRTRRYETPSALADDLGRYLANEPVLAAPPSAAYRARKLAYRYRRGLVVAGIVATIAIAAGGVVVNSSISNSRSTARAREADRQKELAELLSERSIETIANPFEDQVRPRLRAEWSQRVDVLRSQFGHEHPRTIRAEALLILLDWNTAVRRYATGWGGGMEAFKGEIAQLGTSLKEIRQRARGVLAAKDLVWVGLANAATQSALLDKGSADEVDACYKDLCEGLATAFGASDPMTLGMQVERVTVLFSAKLTERAIPLLQAYVDVRRSNKVISNQALDIRHESLITAVSQLKTQPDDALMGAFMKIYYDDGMAIFPRNKASRLQASLTYARWLCERGLYAETERVCAEADDSGRSDSSNFHLHTPLLLDLGIAKLELGKADEAEPILRRAVERIASLQGKDGYVWYRAIGRHGEALAALNRFSEAEPLLLSAQRGMSETREPSGVTLWEIERERSRSAPRLAALYEKMGKPDEAARWRRLESDRTDHPALMFFKSQEALQQKRSADAVQTLSRLAIKLGSELPSNHPQRIAVERFLVSALTTAKQFDEAMRQDETSLASVVSSFGGDHSAALRLRLRRAAILQEKGDVPGARKELDSLSVDIERAQKPYSKVASELAAQAAMFFETNGPPELATQWRARADELSEAFPPLPRNLDFEEGDLNEIPPGWVSPALRGGIPDFAWVTHEGAYHGERCVVLSTLDGFSSIPADANAFRNLMQRFDASPWAGKSIRLSAAIRAACTAPEDSAMMWLRIDMKSTGAESFLSNMADRQIRTDEWKVYEIQADVPADAGLINIGVMAQGGATVRVDDVHFEVVTANR